MQLRMTLNVSQNAEEEEEFYCEVEEEDLPDDRERDNETPEPSPEAECRQGSWRRIQNTYTIPQQHQVRRRRIPHYPPWHEMDMPIDSNRLADRMRLLQELENWIP